MCYYHRTVYLKASKVDLGPIRRKFVQIESVTLENFRCFGGRETFTLDSRLTALIGSNGTGKTAAFQALQRVFGISVQERTIRFDDFHVPYTENDDTRPNTRSLQIEIIIGFPELNVEGADVKAVPDFFKRMATDENGNLKCRIVLESTWTADGTIDGSIETRLYAVRTLTADYTDRQVVRLSPAERSRIQFVYVPASRDGAKQMTTFLRGRIWKAAIWSKKLQDKANKAATDVSEIFHKETATEAVMSAFRSRWRQLHGAGTHSELRFQPIESDIDQLVGSTGLTFEPDPASTSRPAHLLSDGQRSLLHLALTTATLDLESKIENEPMTGFDRDSAFIPALTVLAIEEPENNLSPYYLSRIISQLFDLVSSQRVQAVLSSHSSSVMSRIAPTAVRYFRQDATTGETSVRKLTLPPYESEAGTYVREAVLAHPELYFARFVLLGEGDSEKLVIPVLARASGFDLDPSFVAMVPLGGRHTHHFWKLLSDLEIPYATLLDFDYGRHGGGPARYRTAAVELEKIGVRILEELSFASSNEIVGDLAPSKLATVKGTLEKHGVFFQNRWTLIC